MNAPARVRCALAGLLPKSIDLEKEKARAWNDLEILVVSCRDIRLSLIEREIVDQIGARLYRKASRG
jgi:hypothetical protein